MPALGLITGAFKSIPRWVWYALAAALAYHFAMSWHRGQVRDHDRDVVAARDLQWRTRLQEARADALKWKTQAEGAARTIAETERKLLDEENRRIAGAADALRLRGPGQASAAAYCRQGGRPGPATLPGGQGAGSGAGADARAPVSGENGEANAVVPWGWLVSVIEQADANRAEVLTTRSNDDKQRAAWAKMKNGEK